MQFSTSTVATVIGFLASYTVAVPPDPSTLWQVKPDLDYNDTLYAGWDQIPVIKEVEVYNGVKQGRTYAHHPELFAIGETVYLIHSSAPIDEDSMGQDVWISTSKDAGMTWSEGSSLFPAALLPNQTDAAHNYSYYCDLKVAQRAWQALTFVHLPGPDENGELYAIGQSGSRWCPGRFMTAGRIARRITLDGETDGDPCWIEKNGFTESQLFNETVYGTKYGMKGCERACEINEKLIKPNQAPAWSPWLYNNELFASDNAHSMQEQTFAVWFNDSSSSTGGYWQRFWRDISGDSTNTQKLWVEYNEETEGRGWYPRRLAQYGNEIFQTNIPDARTKQYLGQVAESGDRFLVWNPRWNSQVRERQPLTVAMSRGEDQTYRSVGVLRTNASSVIAPDTRDGIKTRAHGFSYPTAVQVQDKLLVAYSENKENIWVSVVNLDDLPK